MIDYEKEIVKLKNEVAYLKEYEKRSTYLFIVLNNNINLMGNFLTKVSEKTGIDLPTKNISLKDLEEGFGESMYETRKKFDDA